MNTCKRILLHIIRKPINSILIVLLFIVLCTGTLLCLSVRQGAEAGINELLNTMAVSYKVAIDKTQTDPNLFKTTVFEDGSSMTQYLGGLVDDDLVEKLLLNAEYQDYNLTKYTRLLVRGISLFPAGYTMEIERGGEDEDIEYAKMCIKKPTIYGVRKSVYHDLFVSGACKLVEGRHIEPEDVGKVVVSKGLAMYNQLSIGDTFTVEWNEDFNTPPPKVNDKTIGEPMPVEIVGIFDVFDGYHEPLETEAESIRLENFIFLDMETLKTIYFEYKKFTQMEYDDLTFFVDDPAELNDAVDKLSNIDVEWHYYAITKGDSRYEASSKPLHMIRTVLTVLTIFLLIGCGTILFLMLKFQQESRSREAGVLLSIGVKRSGLIAQYLAETIILLVIAFSLTTFIVPPIAQRFGDRALAASVSMGSNDKMRVKYNFLKAEFEIDAVATPPEELIINIEPELLWFVGLTLAAVVTLSVLLSVLPIVRMKPIDILTIPR